METISKLKNVETSTKINSNDNINPSFEVVVIEDNHLTNKILSRINFKLFFQLTMVVK